MDAGPKSLNQSLENTLDLLELLSSRAPLRSGEVARYLGLRPNTANNALRTLYRRGYVSQDDDGRYHLGAQCFFLGQADHVIQALRRLALPDLLELSRETGDNAFLGVECDGRLYMVAHAEGTNPVRATEPQKWQQQFHCSAAGKVILAERGLEWFRQTTRGAPLVRLTSRTLTTEAALERDIKATCEAGFAQCVDEAVEGLHAVGVAVRRADGAFVGALSQSFPSFFVTQGRIHVATRVSRLRECARRLGQRLARVRGLSGADEEEQPC